MRRLLKRKNKPTPSTSEGVLESEHLKEINIEMYKRNAELAVKNQTLSLLQKLYEISTNSLEIKELTTEIVDQIRDELKLPFVGILLHSRKDRKLIPIALSTDVDISKDLKANSAKEFPPGISFSRTDHPCLQVLKTKRKRHVTKLELLVKTFLSVETIHALQKDGSVKTTLVYPLYTSKHKLGVLLISLNRTYKDLNSFEKESISSIVPLVAISLDKASVYEELKDANVKLKQLDELKTEFLSIATHQLRTPLSIIKGFISLLDEGAYGKVNKEQHEIYHNIDVSNERLVKLVDEFLNISRIEQGRTKYTFEKMSATEVLNSVIEELKEKARPKSIKLVSHIDKVPNIIGDADRLRHCFFNFIDNAIKYNEVSSTVEISIDSYKKGIRFRVNDTGPGLDAKDIKNLFQKFYRSTHVSRDFEGTGLGIFVVKEFVEAHGGNVWAKSDGIGKGSEFGFWLPLKAKKRRRRK